MKKKIMNQTLMFIGILFFITIFKSIFGSENSLVGVSILIVFLTSLTKNFTINPIRNFLSLVCISLGSGILSFIAGSNIWFGIIINFAVLFFIGYFFSVNLTKQSIVPYGLQYLFMLFSPVYGDIYVKRLIALIIGPIIIMIAQFLIYHKEKVKIEESQILEYEENDESYQQINIFGKEMKIHLVRAEYAMRVGIITAITGFIASILAKYYNINEGRWMVYTIFSLTELYSEQCKIRSKQRLEATIIGTVIVLLLFMFIRGNSSRMLIILIAGYLNSFFTNYRDSMIIVTVSVVASEVIATGSILNGLERLLFVAIGTVFALLGNKYIFFKKNIGVTRK